MEKITRWKEKRKLMGKKGKLSRVADGYSKSEKDVNANKEMKKGLKKNWK